MTNRRVTALVEVTYRGGPESQWLLKCRGQRYVLPGWLCLEDVMSLLHHENR
jgi:hypothetical protein